MEREQILTNIKKHFEQLGVAIAPEVAEYLDGLSDQILAALLLRLGDVPNKDIAIALGISEARVSQYFHHNLTRLQTLILETAPERKERTPMTYAQAQQEFGILKNGKFRWDSGEVEYKRRR